MQNQSKKLAYRLGECRVLSLPNTDFRNNQESFVRSSDRCVVLEPDTQNKSDRSAVKVVGIWQDVNGLDHIAQIGWLPSEVAYEIALKIPGAPLHANVIWTSATADIRGPFVYIDLWYVR